MAKVSKNLKAPAMVTYLAVLLYQTCDSASLNYVRGPLLSSTTTTSFSFSLYFFEIESSPSLSIAFYLNSSRKSNTPLPGSLMRTMLAIPVMMPAIPMILYIALHP